METNTKLIGTLATLMLATLAIVGLTATGGAAVATEQVTIDDPVNDTVEVDVDYSSAVDATVELVDDSGTVVDSQTISGSANTTETFTVSASEAGDYSVNLTTTGTDSDVTISETRLIAERAVSVTDAGNETVAVDVDFIGETNATADIELTDSADTVLYTDTVEYDATSDTTIHTVEINDSDGLVDGDLTASIAVNPGSAYAGAYATVEDPDSGLFGGSIAGQDTTVVIAAALVLGGVGYYAREGGYL